MRNEDREDLDLFEMANLYPATTGLPMTVWVSPRGHARHAARIKVCMTHGNKMDANQHSQRAHRAGPAPHGGQPHDYRSAACV